jgi:NTP pyrophosphatase (non-canonical NTP hydrolase)
VQKTNAAKSGMEKYDLSDPFAAIRAEIARARNLHPGNHHLFLALVEEVGEIAEAVQRGDIEHARQEAVQVACLAVRLIEEKDASWFSAKNDEKPPESTLNE